MANTMNESWYFIWAFFTSHMYKHNIWGSVQRLLHNIVSNQAKLFAEKHKAKIGHGLDEGEHKIFTDSDISAIA